MHSRSFLAGISAVLLISIAVFDHGIADRWPRHERNSEIEFSPPRVQYDIESAELWRHPANLTRVVDHPPRGSEEVGGAHFVVTTDSEGIS